MQCHRDYLNILTLPKPDCSGEIWNSFYNNRNKLMILSDKYADDDEFKRMYGYFLMDTALKSKKNLNWSKVIIM